MKRLIISTYTVSNYLYDSSTDPNHRTQSYLNFNFYASAESAAAPALADIPDR